MAKYEITQDESGNFYVFAKGGKFPIAGGNSEEEAKQNAREYDRRQHQMFEDGD